MDPGLQKLPFASWQNFIISLCLQFLVNAAADTKVIVPLYVALLFLPAGLMRCGVPDSQPPRSDAGDLTQNSKAEGSSRQAGSKDESCSPYVKGVELWESCENY